MTTIAAQIAYQAISALTPYAQNAHTHSEEQIAAIAQSMREWGWTMPVLVAQDCEGVPDGGIIAGHGRVLAAVEIYSAGGIIKMSSGEDIPDGQVPYIVARGWTEAQRRAYVIADNQLTLLGGWDEGVLRMELLDLRDMRFNLSLTGFDDSTLAGYLDVPLETETDPDGPAPEPPALPIARTGDIWALGRHRLLCGDATRPEDVAAVLGEARPHLMVTDPPYGVDYDPEWRAERGVNRNRAKMGRVANDDRIDWQDAWKLFPGDVAYIWHASWHTGQTQRSLESSAFEVICQLIWAKDRMALSRGDYHWQHEPCWYAVRKGKTHRWAGDRSQTTVWRIAARDDAGHGHGTQKPLSCMRQPMLNSSLPGDAVYDPFVGSGTTIIAAEVTGRKCYAIEINPAYVDVAIMRWQNVTGQRAVHAETGQSFEMLTSERADGAADLGVAHLQQGRG